MAFQVTLLCLITERAQMNISVIYLPFSYFTLGWKSKHDHAYKTCTLDETNTKYGKATGN